MMILILTLACNSISATFAVLGVLWTVVDREHTLHADMLVARGSGRGLTGLINTVIRRAVDGIKTLLRRRPMQGYQPIPASACDVAR